jgi:hypothetical protein
MPAICEKCQGVFKTQYYLDRHKNKKLPCAPEEKKKRNIENTMCPHCKHVYTKPCVLRDHLPKCHLKPYQTETEELKQIILKLSDKLTETTLLSKEQITKLENKIDKLTTANNTINIQNIQNIQNNMIIVPFGKEDLSFLTLKDYTKIFNKGCYSIPEIVKLIHCNENKPEFMNVYIKNFKDEYMFTFDGKDWDIEKKDVVLNNMIENKKNLLESKFDDMQNDLPQYAITMFKKFLERSDDDEVIANIKDELKNMFYKNRNNVIKTTKTQKKPNKTICDTLDNINISNDIINDDDYICEINLIALSNESREKKPTKKLSKVKNTNISTNNNIIVNVDDYICETNLFLKSIKNKPKVLFK